MNEKYPLASNTDPDFDNPHPYTKSWGDGSERGHCRCGREKEHPIHKEEGIKQIESLPKTPLIDRKEEYPSIGELVATYKGKRVRCLEMPQDPHPIPAGTEGICTGIDGIGQLLMKWDNGSTLNLIPGVDKFEVIEKTRQLISLYKENYGSHYGQWFVDYAYYINGKFTGETEKAHLTAEQLYQALKPYLKYEAAK